MLPRAPAGAGTGTASSRALEDLKIRCGSLGNGDDAESSATSAVSAAAHHLVYAVLTGIDRTGKAVTVTTATSELDTPRGHRIPEWCCSFKIDRIPPKLDKGVA